MEKHTWVKEFKGAVTVCDAKGRIIEMNDAAIEIFAEDGGEKLIGTDVLDCHPALSRSKLKGLMENQKINIYTVQKRGKKYLVHQSPWYNGGHYAGFIEIVVEIPWELPHFNRD